jgi:hypothetical protein
MNGCSGTINKSTERSCVLRIKPIGRRFRDQSMIRKIGYRFSLATYAKGVCAEIMLKQKDRAG